VRHVRLIGAARLSGTAGKEGKRTPAVPRAIISKFAQQRSLSKGRILGLSSPLLFYSLSFFFKINPTKGKSL